MIRFERECEVTCETCKRPAVRRQVEVVTDHNGRMVVYDTHADSAHQDDHQAALKRIEDFHVRLHTLENELRELLRENPPKGFLVLMCEIDALRPTACEVRSQIVARMDIQAFGLRAAVELTARKIDGQTADSLLDELMAGAEEAKAQLKTQHESGKW